MQILQVASEMTPIAKVGGLGDVLMGLTRELSWKGHETLAVIPFYGLIEVEQLTAEGRVDWFDTEFDGVKHRACVSYFHIQNDISIALLDTQTGYFRNRRTIYGNGDGLASFLFFCRAVADWLLTTKRHPDILHVHDWPAALLPSFYQILAREKPSFKSVLTIHNFEYQGRCIWGDISRVGIHSEDFSDPSLLQDPIHPCLNLVKGGLLSVDAVTTVSPTHAREMMTPEEGQGLDAVLASLGNRFIGILNGLDYAFWNPEIDTHLAKRYEASQEGMMIRSAKRQNKESLFFNIGVPFFPNVPLIASVTRLVKQKGIYLIRDLFAQAEELNFQCLVLGSVPEPEAEHAFAELDSELRSKGRGAVFLMSDEAFAHRTYAASDIFVIPSLFEPCGLTQLIALKYGSIPVVRRTGGLADTIIDVQKNLPTSNGFSFETLDSSHFTASVVRALDLFKNKETWEELMLHGMRQDFSWNRAGSQYVALYQSLL
jgi:starch synthase